MSNITIKELKCGVKVILEKTDFVKSCALGIFVKTGSSNEEPEFYGASHFIEHMMFKGTKNKTAKEIAESTEKLGAQVNAYTSLEHTCYYIKSMSEYIYKGADTLFEMLNESIFDEKEINRERKVILEEMKMSEDSPDDLCYETINGLVFKNTPYGHPIIGNRKSLKGLDREKLMFYKNKEYTKDSILVSVCGNFDMENMCSYLEDKFYNLKDSKPILSKPNMDYTPSKKIIKKDIAQTNICLGTRTFPYASFDRYKLAMLNEIFGGGMSSRLFQNIRERKGLCYSIYTMMQSYVNDGIFLLYGGIAHDKIDSFIDAVDYEFTRAKKEPISKDEFDKAYILIKSGLIYSSESIISMMFSNGKSYLNSNKLVTRDDNLALIENVTLNDVNELANRLFNLELYSKAIVTGK